MNHAVRPFLCLFALIWLALGMSVPVSAWAIHDTAHSVAQVGVDDHHHHDEDGSISVHDHEDNEAPDGGHDHMPSILLGAATIPDAGITLSAPMIARQIMATPSTHGLERNASDGLRRPPRLG